MKIAITGGAGFVGFNLSTYLKQQHPHFTLIAFDNLSRLGSEQNVHELKKVDIQFVHGDVRNPLEVKSIGPVDFIIHCASDASVLSGITTSSELLFQNNLMGSINIFEHAVQNNAQLIFFSTNRVYNCQTLNEIKYTESSNRFILSNQQKISGLSNKGISEDFPVHLSKTFYGASKYCCESILKEYGVYRNLKYVINRFGIISGRGQFGVQQQGIISYWLKQYLTKSKLTYFGYGGLGKQVRDALHVDDLCRIINLQLQNLSSIDGETFNVGGGFENSFSLRELTQRCTEITGNNVQVISVPENRLGDIPIFYTDNSKVQNKLNWCPKYTLNDILEDLLQWYKP